MNPNIVLGPLVVVIVVIAWKGLPVPVLGHPTTALVAVLAAGMAMCTRGIGRVAAESAWTHPMALLSYVLGGAAVAAFVLALSGVKMPFIADKRAAVVLIGAITAIKVGVTAFHRLILK